MLSSLQTMRPPATLGLHEMQVLDAHAANSEHRRLQAQTLFADRHLLDALEFPPDMGEHSNGVNLSFVVTNTGSMRKPQVKSARFLMYRSYGKIVVGLMQLKHGMTRCV